MSIIAGISEKLTTPSRLQSPNSTSDSLPAEESKISNSRPTTCPPENASSVVSNVIDPTPVARRANPSCASVNETEVQKKESYWETSGRGQSIAMFHQPDQREHRILGSNDRLFDVPKISLTILESDRDKLFRRGLVSQSLNPMPPRRESV